MLYSKSYFRFVPFPKGPQYYFPIPLHSSWVIIILDMKTVIHSGNADPKAVDLYSSLSTAYVLLWGTSTDFLDKHQEHSCPWSHFPLPHILPGMCCLLTVISVECIQQCVSLWFVSGLMGGFCCFVLGRVSLCSPDCLGTHYLGRLAGTVPLPQLPDSGIEGGTTMPYSLWHLLCASMRIRAQTHNVDSTCHPTTFSFPHLTRPPHLPNWSPSPSVSF